MCVFVCTGMFLSRYTYCAYAPVCVLTQGYKHNDNGILIDRFESQLLMGKDRAGGIVFGII